MQKNVFISELTSTVYHELVKNGEKNLFLPIGALEQHGAHMTMNTDILIPTAIAEAVALKIGALVAPTITYGYKSQQKSGGGFHLPGTTSLDGATLTNMIRDLIKEFTRHGGRKFILMNGHFENTMFIVEGIDLALRELKWEGIQDVKVIVLSYWDFVTDDVIEKLYPEGFTGWDLEHGGVMETSLMLHLYPHFVDMDKVVDHPPADFPPYDIFPINPDLTPPSGTLSSAKNSSAEKGQVLFETCVEGISKEIIKAF